MRDIMVDTEVIKKAVQLACRAPSLHNSQPWHWVAEDGTVQLYLDKDRVLYSTDHLGREALIGCGGCTGPLPGGNGGRGLDGQCRQVSQPQQSPTSGVD